MSGRVALHVKVAAVTVVSRPFRSLTSLSAIFRQLRGMFRGQPDLKDAWPQFSGDKKALSAGSTCLFMAGEIERLRLAPPDEEAAN